jgi:hypothetical protein
VVSALGLTVLRGALLAGDALAAHVLDGAANTFAFAMRGALTRDQDRLFLAVLFSVVALVLAKVQWVLTAPPQMIPPLTIGAPRVVIDTSSAVGAVARRGLRSARVQHRRRHRRPCRCWPDGRGRGRLAGHAGRRSAEGGERPRSFPGRGV